MSQIRITPEELYQGAESINKIAGQILENLTNLKSTVDGVANNWEGAAQSSFIASFEALYGDFVKTFPPTIEGVASQMKAAGETLEEADAQIAAAFSAQ